MSSYALLNLWDQSGVATWHMGLTKCEWGLGHLLAPIGAVLRQGFPISEGRHEIEFTDQ